MNILTFDIEEWVLEKEHFGNRREKYAKFDKTLDYILELLAANNQSATFFCLGKLALNFPHVIRKIASQGHEIGSHYSYRTHNSSSRTIPLPRSLPE